MKLLNALCVSFLAWSFSPAASAGDIVSGLGNRPTREELTEKITAEVKTSIGNALAEYDALIEREPYDVTLQIERCNFLGEYISSFEGAVFVDDLYDLSNDCDARLSVEFAGHPEILLRSLEATYGEERERLGKEILATLLTEGWTQGQIARLHTALSKAAQLANRSREAENYARVALNYDETADVRLILAEAHLKRGEIAESIALLTTPFDEHRHDEPWYVLEKMKVLSRAGAIDDATSLYEHLVKSDYYNHLEAARALRSANAIDLARLEIQKATESHSATNQDEQQLFFLEFHHGTSAAALEAYNAWRDAGLKQDPIGINRLALATRDITLPWKARDLLSFFVAVLVLAGAIATCGTPVALVHYWGFVRRHRTASSYPTGGWQLRHAWAALAAFAVMAIIGIYTAAPLELDFNALHVFGTDVQPVQWSRYAFFEALLTTLAMILVLKVGPTSENQRPWATQWGPVKALVLGIVIGIALRIPFLVTALSTPDAIPQLSDSDMWAMLRYVRDELGLITALWVLGLVAPVVEEFLFRRVLLDAFSSHVGFARANVLQAALFAAIHLDARAFLPLFGLGLLLAYLTRRSGGLLAPMMIHAVFNLVAGILLLR